MARLPLNSIREAKLLLQPNNNSRFRFAIYLWIIAPIARHASHMSYAYQNPLRRMRAKNTRENICVRNKLLF